jgi:hypothetical protein
MANLFDATNAPEGEPAQIVVGDFAQWKRSDLVDDYPVATHSAEYVARISSNANEIKIAATENSDYYLFTVSSNSSIQYEPGKYHWQLEITETSSGNRIVLDRGTFEVLIDLEETNADPRIHAEIMVQKIESLLQGKADSDVSNYSIAGRSLTKMSFTELTDARDYYKREIIKAENESLLKRGKKNSATIRARF